MLLFVCSIVLLYVRTLIVVKNIFFLAHPRLILKYRVTKVCFAFCISQVTDKSCEVVVGLKNMSLYRDFVI
jgi:hypothetical protein